MSRRLDAAPLCYSFVNPPHPTVSAWTPAHIISGETFTHLEILSPKKEAKNNTFNYFVSICFVPHMVHRLTFEIKKFLKILTFPLRGSS